MDDHRRNHVGNQTCPDASLIQQRKGKGVCGGGRDGAAMGSISVVPHQVSGGVPEPLALTSACRWQEELGAEGREQRQFKTPSKLQNLGLSRQLTTVTFRK